MVGTSWKFVKCQVKFPVTSHSQLLHQFSSVAQSCPTLCNPMNCSTQGLPVHHQLPESTQTHVYWVGDAIQPSHPLSSPPPPALNLSQHQGLFKWVSSLHQVAKVLEFQLQHQPFQWTPRTDLLQDGLVGSPYSPRDAQESSPTSQFKSITSSALSFLHGPALTSIHAAVAAAAALLQSCPTLYDPIDGSPRGSPVLGFSRQEHWTGLPFPSPMHESEKWKVKVKSLSHVWLLATPWTAAYQALLSMGFSR